ALARRWGSSSDLGAQLDSLTDISVFGIAPAFLFAKLHFSDGALIGSVAAATFVLACGFRLARYNVETGNSNFKGLPTTVGGPLLAITAVGLNGADLVFHLLALVFLAFLMVSTIEYSSVKRQRGRLSWMSVPFAGLAVALPVPLLCLIVGGMGVIYVSNGLLRDNSDGHSVWRFRPRH
ncbi:MAG: hypothetical protein HY329_24800, partial [Chloroflexi bacterium]|nr:hypothetical protein [Chloroflexota bacterium]